MERLAELIVLNYGKIDFTEEIQFMGPQKAENALGRVGLSPPEAFELNYMRGHLEGIMYVAGYCLPSVIEILKDQTRMKETGSLIATPTIHEMRRFG